MRFNNIQIDRIDIPQEKLNIDIKTRSNLFTWNGQFSPQLVETLLEKYSNPGDATYDPFCGSGTTICESARKGLISYGVELNPSAYYMAKSYEICHMEIQERKNLLKDIDKLVFSIDNAADIIPNILSTVNATDNSYIKNTLSLLIVLFDLFSNQLSVPLMYTKWEKLKGIISTLPFSSNFICVELADTRHTSFSDDSMDLVITSPPYINVFNYHQKYRRSVETLGYDVLKIAKKEFGSNRRNRGNRFLTVIGYCIDIALAIKEIIRVSRTDARLILIIGRESTVLGQSFCNSELVYNICCNIFELEFLLRQERVFKNRFGQMIYEDILHFKNKKDNTFNEQTIMCSARKIAVEMMSDKLSLCDSTWQNYDLLKQAIETSERVNKSED